MTKSELKDIIKECFCESGIIEESIKIIDKYSDTGRLTTAKIGSIQISINDNASEEDLSYLERDLKVIKTEYKKFLNNEFKKWLKISEKEFKDLKLYAIEYKYIKSSNTSEFEFDFEYHTIDESGKKSKGTHPVAMGLKVSKGKVSKDSFYNI